MAGTASGTFSIDTRAINKLAGQLIQKAPPIIRDEMKTTATTSAQIITKAANAHVNHRGKGKPPIAQGWRYRNRINAQSVTITIFNIAPHAGWVDEGRGAIVAKRAKALRFEIDGQVLFRKSVGPAPAQHYTIKGMQDAEPQVIGEFARCSHRIVTRVLAS